MEGVVEADEAFVGGTLKKMSKWRRAKRRGPRLGKTAVFGLLERGEGKGKSRVRAMIVPTNWSNALLPRVFENVALFTVPKGRATEARRARCAEWQEAPSEGDTSAGFVTATWSARFPGKGSFPRNPLACRAVYPSWNHCAFISPEFRPG